MSKSSTAAIAAMNNDGQRVKRKYTLRNKAAVVPPVAQVEEAKVKRQYIQSGVVIDPGVPCKHCRALYGHTITNTYHNGNRRRICGSCGLPFISMRKNEQ